MAVQKNTWPSKNGSVKVNTLHICTLGSPLFPIFLALSRSLHRHSSVAQGHPHTVSSFRTLSIRDTPTKLLKHFISRTFTFRLLALLILHASAQYNAVGTITPSYIHFLAFISNPLLRSTLFNNPHALYPSFILCTTSLSHPP